MTPGLEAAYERLDSHSRIAIADYATRFPNCLAAAVGAAMTRGVPAREIEGVVAAMVPNTRGLLYVDAARQQRVAENRGARSRAAFYGALAAVADRKQLPL